MKYIVTKSQLLEATKFPKGKVVTDKYCPIAERLIMEYYGDKICDILVFPTQDNEHLREEYSHYVLISYNGYSVKGKNGTSEKIETLIEGFLPIKSFVIIMDNDSGCNDDDSNL